MFLCRCEFIRTYGGNRSVPDPIEIHQVTLDAALAQPIAQRLAGAGGPRFDHFDMHPLAVGDFVTVELDLLAGHRDVVADQELVATIELVHADVGLQLGGHEYKMRSPIAKLDNGAMSFACGIPEGSVIQIMESDPTRQIASASEAARRAVAQLQGRPIAGALVFDCICRKSILGDHFRDAISSMYAALQQAPLAGFETYGEIALDTGEMSGFHNTTTVVLAFPA